MRAQTSNESPLSASITRALERPRELLHLKDVCKRVGLSKSTVYKLISEDAFPRQLRMQHCRTSRWSGDSIDAWIASVVSGESQENAQSKERPA